MCACGPVMAGKRGDLLKAVSLNASLIYCSSFGTLASVAGYGSVCGFGGLARVSFGLVGDSLCTLLAAGIMPGWDGMVWGKHNSMI